MKDLKKIIAKIHNLNWEIIQKGNITDRAIIWLAFKKINGSTYKWISDSLYLIDYAKEKFNYTFLKAKKI